MRIEEKVYADELGKISDITNYVESLEDLAEVFKEFAERIKNGYELGKIQTTKSINGLSFKEELVIDFKKGEQWKYIKICLDLKT